MMKAVAIISAILLVAVANSASAQSADCALSARVPAGGAQTLYDPFSPVNTVIVLEVAVENNGDQACSGQFYVAPRTGELQLGSGVDNLLYRVEGSRGGGSTLPNGFGPFLAQVPAHGSTTVKIQFTVLAQQIVPKGDYTSELVLAGVGAGNTPVAFNGDYSLLRVHVPARVEMSISGTAAPALSNAAMRPASIEFGEAHSGDTGRVFVNVWSNGSVTVTLDSENHGVLAHEDNPALPPLPYSATFDGAPINLASTYVVGRTPPLSTTGASYPFSVTLGNVSGKFAGRYKDIVTINVNQN